MKNKVYLTQEGVEKLRLELDDLINKKRPALAARLNHAIQQGDLSENADYQTAKEEQGFLEGRIQQVEVMLLDAVLIEPNQEPKDEVDLGCQVTVVEEGMDIPETFFIIGDSVNLAKRLQDLAAPNQILLGLSTYELVKKHVVVRELEPVQVKGRKAVERIFELIDLEEA